MLPGGGRAGPGCSSRLSTALLIRFVVVSWPPTTKLKEPENLLLGQALAIDLGLDEIRQQVIMRTAAPLLDHVCEVRAHFDRNRPEIARCTLRLRPTGPGVTEP